MHYKPDSPRIEIASVVHEGAGGEVVLPIMAYTERIRPKEVQYFFRLRVYEKVGISLVEVIS